MVWRPFVPTTDRSMILATRGRSEGLDEKRPITEALLWQIFEEGAFLGFPGVHLRDSWVVGVLEGRPWTRAGRRNGYPASCTTSLAEGMSVRTQSPTLQRLRHGVLELYLSDFPPSEIPEGWSEFRETLQAEGVTENRYEAGCNHFDSEIDASNPYFLFDPAKCIVCIRCLRACAEVQGIFAITIAGRSFESKVVASQDQPFFESECVGCGACVQACASHTLVEKSLFEGDYRHVQSAEA